MDTIVNMPLHPKTGLPMLHKTEVEERKKVHFGWHMQWRALLLDDRGRLYLRMIIE